MTLHASAATAPVSRPASVTPERVRTARTTGLLYLGVVITGLVSYLLIRQQLFVPDKPDTTLSNLLRHETLARVGIVMELGVVLTQALASTWFYRLFRDVDSFAAGLIAAFGLINATVVLGSAALLATALDVSNDASLSVAGGAATNVQLMYVISGHLWTVGGIFFGLWLIPMGWLARRSGWMPRALGWLLMVGGIGYVLNALLAYLFPHTAAVDLLTVPATAGELWMVAYLILRGVRRHIAPPPRVS
jgi:Domain of unknown function (DUF4386)